MRADGTRPYDAYVQRAVVDAAVEETCRKLGVHPLPHSFPFLLSGSSGQVIEPMLSFLAAKFVVRQMPGTASRMRNSPHTRTATAADLNHFLDYLDASRLSLNDTTDDVIEGYAGSMLGRKSRATGNEYAHETVSRRLSTLRAFLSWMQNESRLPHRLRVLGTTEREYSGSVGHGLKAGRLDGERERDGTINVLMPEEARAIFQALGSLPSQAMRGESSRDRLAAQLALDTGLRRSEVTSVMVKDVTLALSKASAAKPYAMQVLRVFGKGRRWRKILVPVWLLQELSTYIHNERRESVENPNTHFHVNPGSTYDMQYSADDLAYVLTSIAQAGGSTKLMHGAAENAAIAKSHNLLASKLMTCLAGISQVEKAYFLEAELNQLPSRPLQIAILASEDCQIAETISIAIEGAYKSKRPAEVRVFLQGSPEHLSLKAAGIAPFYDREWKARLLALKPDALSQ